MALSVNRTKSKEELKWLSKPSDYLEHLIVLAATKYPETKTLLNLVQSKNWEDAIKVLQLLEEHLLKNYIYSKDDPEPLMAKCPEGNHWNSAVSKDYTQKVLRCISALERSDLIEDKTVEADVSILFAKQLNIPSEPVYTKLICRHSILFPTFDLFGCDATIALTKNNLSNPEFFTTRNLIAFVGYIQNLIQSGLEEFYRQQAGTPGELLEIEEKNNPPPLVAEKYENCAFNSLRIGRNTKISFHRTLRVPEDGNDYSLPADFGTFPIHRVEDYADTVPPQWLEDGGFFIPLYQREALFIQFDGEEWFPAIAKVCVGEINAITGKSYSEKLSSHSQDYVVVPKQKWLDGINSGNGKVKQFVAMPLGQGYTVEAQITDEEKYGGFQLVVYEPVDDRFRNTQVSEKKIVEYIISACHRKFDRLLSQSNLFQRTIVKSVQDGKASCSKIAVVTGLDTERVEFIYQDFRKRFLEIVSATITQHRYAYKDDYSNVSAKVFLGLRSLALREHIDPEKKKDGEILMSPMSSPAPSACLGSSPAPARLGAPPFTEESEEMGIAAGGIIKQQIFSDPYGLEAWNYNRRRVIKAHIVNSMTYKAITGLDPPPSPITAEQYQNSGISFFSYYDETSQTVKAALPFSRILGVEMINKRRGRTTSPSTTEIQISPELVQRIKTPDINEAILDFRSRARENAEAGRWRVALREISYLIDSGNTLQASDYAIRSSCHYQIKNYFEAAIDADIALEINPEFYEVLAIRARCRLALGDYLGSKEDAQLLTQVRGNESVGYELMAEANMLLSDYAGAISDAFFATLFNPQNRRAHEISRQAREVCDHSEKNDYNG